MHVALVWKVVLPLALLFDVTVSAPTVSQRATPGATFEVYTLPGCGETGKNGQQSTIYQLSNKVCVNTPPIPQVDDRFLSYKGNTNVGATVSVCFLDVFPDENCTGIYTGFQSGPDYSGPDYSNKCNNVLQGFTEQRETYGAKSVQFSCVTPSGT